jgi:hypothetical protein
VIRQTILDRLPPSIRRRLDAATDVLSLLSAVREPSVIAALAPSAVRGLILQRGHHGDVRMRAHHVVRLDLAFTPGDPAIAQLYDRASKEQWTSDQLAWKTSVDPLDPEVPLLPSSFLAFDELERLGVRLDDRGRRALLHETATWMLSQFLHGEQGALLASAQVTECVASLDSKLLSASQVMDEARHVEVFHRYLQDKLGGVVPIDDNLFVIIDALMTDSRWDMKVLGMQIMVEGLALGAFGTLYRATREPLLRDLLRRVMRDEARHVHFGVLALREHFRLALSERERREREDWAFEMALLMRDRFMLQEIYLRRFEGVMSRAQWRGVVEASPGMREFRRIMFARLVPNLRAIGLISPRVHGRYEAAGLLELAGGRSANEGESEEDLAMWRAA